MADVPQLCVGLARALKEHGETTLDLANAVIRFWLEPDGTQEPDEIANGHLLKATITVGEYHKMVMTLGQAALLSKDPDLAELAGCVAATCATLFYAMPDMFLGLANASCFLQQNTLIDEEEDKA